MTRCIFREGGLVEFSSVEFASSPVRQGADGGIKKDHSVMTIEPLRTQRQEPRVIDPNSPVERQRAALDSLIQNPPENSRILTISPPLAADILAELNGQNRTKRPMRIRRFGNDMSAGKWRLTGDTIKFGRSGLLRDGQNRLAACVQSNTSFRTHVVFGVDDKAFSVMDTGATRTGIDAFKIAGVPHSRVAAPAVRWLAIYDKNALDPDRGWSIDNSSLLEYFKSNVDTDRLNTAIQRAITAGRPFPPGPLAALLYRFDARDPRVTKAFAADLEKREHGARKLTEKLINLRKQQGGRLHELQMHALVIQAFNAYRQKQSVTKATLNWHEGKDFPGIA